MRTGEMPRKKLNNYKKKQNSIESGVPVWKQKKPTRRPLWIAAACGALLLVLLAVFFIVRGSAGGRTKAKEGAKVQEAAGSEYAGEAGYAEGEKGDAGSGSSGPDEVRVVMVGDVLLHDPVNAAALRDDGSYNYDAVFSHTKDEIEAADIAIVNQEVIIGGEELGVQGYPTFNAPYAIADALTDAGFDVICHATNHVMDQGETGIMNCMRYWSSAHPEIEILGIHDSDEDRHEIYVTEKKGIRIAILNYTYGTNGIELPADKPWITDLLDEERIAGDLEAVSAVSDFQIVCPHWGTEYEHSPDDSQAHWVQVFFDCGADLVIGTHPHVIQPVEMVEDAASGRKMLVYYSLGNFVNWTSESGYGICDRVVGGMAEVTIERDEGGNAFISDYGITPVVTQLGSGRDGVTVYFYSDYTPELAGSNLIREQDDSFSYEYVQNLIGEVWGQ